MIVHVTCCWVATISVSVRLTIGKASYKPKLRTLVACVVHLFWKEPLSLRTGSPAYARALLGKQLPVSKRQAVLEVSRFVCRCPNNTI